MAQIGTVRLETQNSGVVDVPVFEPGDSASGIYEYVRVETASGPGFIPVTAPADATYPYLRVQSANDGIVAVTDTAGSDIPDEQDLLSRYDFSQEDGSLPVSDQTGNGNGLDSGNGYTGVGESINGVQAGEFDGTYTDDYVQTTFTSISQPYHVFAVFSPDEAKSKNDVYIDGGSNFEAVVSSGGSGTNGDHYELFAGSSLVSGTSATSGDIVVVSALFNGADSEIRVNQSSTVGNAGSQDLSGITLGATGDGNSNINVNHGELLIYPQDKSGIVTDIEQYLIYKWGPVNLA